MEKQLQATLEDFQLSWVLNEHFFTGPNIHLEAMLSVYVVTNVQNRKKSDFFGMLLVPWQINFFARFDFCHRVALFLKIICTIWWKTTKKKSISQTQKIIYQKKMCVSSREHVTYKYFF
jgi:hypothetical protein